MPAKKQYDSTINFRCTSEQRDFLQAMADERGLDFSELMRSLPEIYQGLCEQLDSYQETVSKLNMKNRKLHDKIDKLLN